MESKRKIYLSLNAPYRIKYEGINDFEDSIFNRVYRQAAKITREIVDKNEEFHNVYRRKGNEYRNNEQIYNVISFVGDRGEGKSSCMLSFAEYLKDYHRIGNVGTAKNYYIGDELAFVGIDAIDAGLLENKEDIVEVVLAKLLGQFQKFEDKGTAMGDSSYDYQRREFNRCLQKVYASNLHRKSEQPVDEYASVHTLNDMAISVNMRENIKELISRYISLVKSHYFSENVPDSKCFVVIPIDDIDMNIAKGYEMLEQIRRYLMVPNVIVLLSYKYEQLERICDLYYARAFEKQKELLSQEVYDKKFSDQISELSKRYMEKVVPDGRRITLETIDNLEHLTEEQVYVIPADSENGKEDAHGSEETFLRKSQRCFDIRSWCPDGGMELWKSKNLRNMCNLYNELHVLADVQMKKEDCKKYFSGESQEVELKQLRRMYEDNYSWLLAHIQHKAGMDLEEKSGDIFKKIMSCSLSGLNKAIIDAYDVFSKPEDEYSEPSLPFLEPKIFAGDHSLGTSLYLLKIIENSEDAKIDTKFSPFVRAYFSAVIGNLYLASDNSESKIKKVIGAGMGYYDTLLLPSIEYKINSEDQKSYHISAGCILGIRGGITIELKVIRQRFYVQNLKKFELLYMFLSNIKGISFKCKGRANVTSLEIQIEKCDFRISNFIWNIFTYREHLGEFYKKLKTCIEQPEMKSLETQSIVNYLEKSALIYELKEWEEKYNTKQVIPLHNTEFLSYMLDKCSRLFSESDFVTTPEQREGQNRIREDKEVHDYMCFLFDKIAEMLNEQDLFYENARRKSDGEILSLKEVFSNCPVITGVKEEVLSIYPSMWMGVSDSMMDIVDDWI